MPNIEVKKDISTLYQNIKTIIDTSKQEVATQVNRTMVLSYWEIGRALKIEILKDKRATYGDEVVKKVSHKLSLEYGRGYSKANLSRMINLYNYFENKQIVATLSQQLSWSHFIEFINSIYDGCPNMKSKRAKKNPLPLFFVLQKMLKW